MGKLENRIQEAAAKEGSRSFLETLRVLGDGQAVSDLTEQAHKLQQELSILAAAKGMEGVSKGTMTVTYRYFVEARGTCVITQEKPVIRTEKPERGGTHLWMTDAKNVSKSPPKQPDLPLAVVAPNNDAPVQEVPDASNER